MLLILPVRVWAQTIGDTTALDDDATLIAVKDKPCWLAATQEERRAESDLYVHPVSYVPKAQENPEQAAAENPGVAMISQAEQDWATCQSASETPLDAQLAAYHGVVVEYWFAFYLQDADRKSSACTKMQHVKAQTHADIVLARENAFLHDHCL